MKVRLQAEGKLPAGVPRRYSGALDAYLTIVRQVIVLMNIINVNIILNIYELIFYIIYKSRKASGLCGLALDPILQEMPL